MANAENIIKANKQRTPQQRRENAKKAGDANARAWKLKKSINELVNAVIYAKCPKEIEDNLKRYFPEGVMNVYDALLKKCVLKALDGKAKLKDLISCILILAKLSGQKLENDTQEGDNGNGILEKLLKANLDIQAKKGKK